MLTFSKSLTEVMMADTSHTLALQAFAYIAGQENQLVQFLEQSGVTPQTAKNDLEKPEMMAAILDFLMENDTVLLSFCTEYDISPEEVWRQRSKLPGAPHHQI